jgi:transposase
MSKKRTHFPKTTPQQRKLLFETWDATGDVVEACQKAHVSVGTFYYWKARFDTEGYAGLEHCRKDGVPKGTGKVPKKVEDKVLALHREHADWGKERIAAELAKANNWVALASPNTVRRILSDAGMWSAEKDKEKKAPSKP